MARVYSSNAAVQEYMTYMDSITFLATGFEVDTGGSCYYSIHMGTEEVQIRWSELQSMTDSVRKDNKGMPKALALPKFWKSTKDPNKLEERRGLLAAFLKNLCDWARNPSGGPGVGAVVPYIKIHTSKELKPAPAADELPTDPESAGTGADGDRQAEQPVKGDIAPLDLQAETQGTEARNSATPPPKTSAGDVQSEAVPAPELSPAEAGLKLGRYSVGGKWFGNTDASKTTATSATKDEVPESYAAVLPMLARVGELGTHTRGAVQWMQQLSGQEAVRFVAPLDAAAAAAAGDVTPTFLCTSNQAFTSVSPWSVHPQGQQWLCGTDLGADLRRETLHTALATYAAHPSCWRGQEPPAAVLELLELSTQVSSRLCVTSSFQRVWWFLRTAA